MADIQIGGDVTDSTLVTGSYNVIVRAERVIVRAGSRWWARASSAARTITRSARTITLYEPVTKVESVTSPPT